MISTYIPFADVKLKNFIAVETMCACNRQGSQIFAEYLLRKKNKREKRPPARCRLVVAASYNG